MLLALRGAGIDAQARPLTDGSFAIWIMDDNDVERAKRLLKGLKNLKKNIVNAVKAAGKFFKKLAKEVGNQLKKLKDGIVSGLKSIVDGIKSVAKGIFNFFRYGIKGILEAGAALLKGDFTGALKALFDNAIRAVGANPATIHTPPNA